jgi:hypothetical protein
MRPGLDEIAHRRRSGMSRSRPVHGPPGRYGCQICGEPFQGTDRVWAAHLRCVAEGTRARGYDV